METALKVFAADTALVVQGAAVFLIAYGALDAFARAGIHVVRSKSPVGWRKELFVWFGMWLLLGLQFALAGDIVTTVISPTWNDIGQLAAIAAIRTFLNFFLEKDIEKASTADVTAPAP